ncbi:hypothetical protein [Flavobacterium taihuense]|uniref:Uncharacterized protein n=1 Tax=Flavobacterium taihuense TaxID=2857508 RepID=A0ABS6XZQ1_9FLAO|nr:hypothetical protein [Flavobacterium taihuense]MBW4362155.1 hypothetical protein [Flavobacterium taihuense]
MELDFGWKEHNNTDVLKISGIYQWHSKTEDESDWYDGFGGGLGSWNTQDNYKNGSAATMAFFGVLT